MHLTRSLRFGVVLAGNLVAKSLLAQEGQLTGRVTDERTGEGIAGTRVLLTGTPRIESTGQDGSYLFRGLKPGEYQVRAVAIGFSAQLKPVTVGPAETQDGRVPRSQCVKSTPEEVL
jgi:hypothetical protein